MEDLFADSKFWISQQASFILFAVQCTGRPMMLSINTVSMYNFLVDSAELHYTDETQVDEKFGIAYLTILINFLKKNNGILIFFLPQYPNVVLQ